MMVITKDNKHYMAVAHLTGQRSYAKRAKVGAVIVKNRSIISEGYNGTYPGDENVCEDENGLILIRLSSGQYNSPKTEAAWKAFQAATKLAHGKSNW